MLAVVGNPLMAMPRRERGFGQKGAGGRKKEVGPALDRSVGATVTGQHE